MNSALLLVLVLPLLTQLCQGDGSSQETSGSGGSLTPITTLVGSSAVSHDASSIPANSATSSSTIVLPAPLSSSSAESGASVPESGTSLHAGSSSTTTTKSSNSITVSGSESSSTVLRSTASTSSVSARIGSVNISSNTAASVAASPSSSIVIAAPTLQTVTTVVDGETTVLPVISGGGISSAIPLLALTTLAPSGSQASSTVVVLATQLSSLSDLIEGWTKKPVNDINPIIQRIDDIEGALTGLISGLEGSSPPSEGGGCTHSLLSLASCIIGSLSKIKGAITGTITDDTVNVVKGVLNSVKELTSSLEDVKDNNPSTTNPSTSPPVSSSCAGPVVTITNEILPCTVSNSSSTMVTSCPKTRFVTKSGCDLIPSTTSSFTTLACTYTRSQSSSELVEWDAGTFTAPPFTPDWDAVTGATAFSLVSVTPLSITGTASHTQSHTTATSFISCSTQNADPDSGITSGYCVCSGSTLSQSTATSPPNSCAYTALPGSTIGVSVSSSVATKSALCEVCTYIGKAAQCSSLPNCSPSTTVGVSSATSDSVYPTDPPTDTGPVACYQDTETGYGKFTTDDADHAIDALCNGDKTLVPGQSVPHREGYTNSGGVKIYAEVSWAQDQSGCSSWANYPISGDSCTGAFDDIMNTCVGTGGEGGGWIAKSSSGCILFTLGAPPADQS